MTVHVFNRSIRKCSLTSIVISISFGLLQFSQASQADALNELDKAIWSAETGIKWMADPKKYNASWPGLQDMYKDYERRILLAKEIDPKSLDLRKEKLEKVSEEFVKPYLALKARNEQQIAVNRAIKADAERSENNLKESKSDSEYRSKKTIAEGRGFLGAWTGITSLIKALGDGRLTLDDAKKKLIFVNTDSFKVASTSEPYIFYISDYRSSEEPIYIAVVRDSEKFYGDGAPLRAPLMSVVGMDRFQTATGTEKDLIILKTEAKLSKEESNISSAPSDSRSSTKPSESGPCGIGAVVSKAKMVPLLVESVLPDGPAGKVGLQPLDHILKIDGVDISELELAEAVSRLRGEENSTVRITVIRRNEADPMEMVVTRAPVQK